MISNDNEPVTVWIEQLKDGDSEAASLIWQKYFDRLVTAGRRKFGAASRRVSDEEDAAVGAFKSLCIGAQNGRFTHLNSREDLWMVLLTLTAQKIVDQIRQTTRQKRGGGEVRGESLFQTNNDHSVAGIAGIAGEQAPAEFVVAMEEEHTRLLHLLPDQTLRCIAEKKLEGCTNEEISKSLGVSVHAVGRKIKRMRRIWANELNPAEAQE